MVDEKKWKTELDSQLYNFKDKHVKSHKVQVEHGINIPLKKLVLLEKGSRPEASLDACKLQAQKANTSYRWT